MKNKIIKALIILYTLCIPAIILAVSSEDVYVEKVAERIEVDWGIFERLDEAVARNDFEDFFIILEEESNEFQDSYEVYKNRPQGLSDEILDIGIKLENASFRISEGSDSLFLLPIDYDEKDFENAIDLIILGFSEYEEAEKILLESREKYESKRGIYLYGTILGAGGFLLFLLISLRKKNDSSSCLAFRLIRNGFGSIGLGFGITLAGYMWMPGNTYYILWGLPLYGAYLIFKGLSSFGKKKEADIL